MIGAASASIGAAGMAIMGAAGNGVACNGCAGMGGQDCPGGGGMTAAPATVRFSGTSKRWLPLAATRIFAVNVCPGAYGTLGTRTMIAALRPASLTWLTSTHCSLTDAWA